MSEISSEDMANFNAQHVQQSESINGDNVSINTEVDPDQVEKTLVEYDNVNFDVESVQSNRNISTSQMRRMMTNISTGIFGMPYQFPRDVDLVVEDTDFGEKYQEKIVSTMPVLFLSPGLPSFMDGYTADEKSAMNSLFDNPETNVDDIIENPDSPFFSFRGAFNSCSKEINTAVRAMAIYAGLNGEEYDAEGRIYNDFMIENVLNSDFKKWFGASTSLAYYLDSDSSISESFSNSTTSSSIMSQAESASDKVREYDFLAGAAGMGSFVNGIQDLGQDVLGGIAGAIDLVSLGLTKNVTNRLSTVLQTVVAGGKMIFPEIWNSSDFSRSYSITIKLRTPDPDPLSVLQNIYTPALALMCMAAGRQIGNSANTYGSPYIVRGTYKSIFNCEMGIISSLDITRGGDDKWNSLGMCTAMDISLTIKDLYSNFMISDNTTGLLNNVAQLDYLALMAGIDMNADWIARNIVLAAKLTQGAILTTPQSLAENFMFRLNRTASNFVKSVLPVTDSRFFQ